MKLRFVTIPLIMAAALIAQPPPGRRGPGGASPDPGRHIEAMLNKFLNLDGAQQNQVHTILADAKVQSQSNRDQLKILRASLADAIKTNNTANIDAFTLEISQVEQPLNAIRSKAAAAIYAVLTADQKAKLGDTLGMLMGGGFGPGMRHGGFGGPPKQ